MATSGFAQSGGVGAGGDPDRFFVDESAARGLGSGKCVQGEHYSE